MNIETRLPIAGVGTSEDPLTLPSPVNGQYNWYYNSELQQWGLYNNPGPTTVTVGDTTKGAMYSTLEAAFKDKCYYVRIAKTDALLDTVEQPSFTFPVLGGNCYIYIDTGASLSFTGVVNWNGAIVSIMGGSQTSSFVEFSGPTGRCMNQYNTLSIHSCSISATPGVTINSGKEVTRTVIANCGMYAGENVIVTGNRDEIIIRDVSILAPRTSTAPTINLSGTPNRVVLNNILMNYTADQIINVSCNNVILSGIYSSNKTLTINVNANNCHFDRLIGLKLLNLANVSACKGCLFTNIDCKSFVTGRLGCNNCKFTNLNCFDFKIEDVEQCNFDNIVCKRDFNAVTNVNRCTINGLTVYKDFTQFLATDSTLSNITMTSKNSKTVFSLGNITRCILNNINVNLEGNLDISNAFKCTCMGINVSPLNGKLTIGSNSSILVNACTFDGISVNEIMVSSCINSVFSNFNCIYLNDDNNGSNNRLSGGYVTGASGIAFSASGWIIMSTQLTAGPMILDGNNCIVTGCLVGKKSSQTIISTGNGALVTGCRTGTSLVGQHPNSTGNALIT